MAKSKTGFDPNAAFKNIIQPEEVQEIIVNRGRPKEQRETKKIKTISVLPSVYEKVKRIAYVKRTNISEVTEKLYEEYIQNNIIALKEYDDIADE